MDETIIGEQNTSECVMGDLNFDGLINLLDIMIVVNIILGSTENIFGTDFNQDGLVNVLDIIVLSNLILN